MMQDVLRTVAAAVSVFGLALQWWLMVRDPTGPGLLSATVQFFSYFTILANSVAACAMIVPLLAPRTRAARFLSKPSVRTAIAGYLIIVGAVYFLLLRNIGDEQDWELVADQVLHYAMPVLFTIDWLVFVPRGQLSWMVIGTSLVIPIIYGVWMMVHGWLAGWYPYPLFNPARVGHQSAYRNLVAFLGMFIVVMVVLYIVDRVLGSLRRELNRG